MSMYIENLSRCSLFLKAVVSGYLTIYYYNCFYSEHTEKNSGQDGIKEKKESMKQCTNTEREGKTGVIYVLLLRN